MKRFLTVIMLFSLPCILCSCKKQAAPKVRIVTGITVTAVSSDKTVTRTYTEDVKMSCVLNYLRLLDPYIVVALTPDTFRSDTYRITVTYSDGGRTEYRQIYHDYFQTDNGSWKRIDPKLGSGLQRIVTQLDDDI